MAYTYLGAVSASAAYTEAKKKPTLKRGSRGAEVAAAQALLNTWIQVYKRGSPIAVDSRFGPAMDAAVRSFQKAVGLSADGIVGVKTWTALIAQQKPVSSRAPTSPGAPSVEPGLPALSSVGGGLPSWVPLAAAGVGLAFLLTSKKKK